MINHCASIVYGMHGMVVSYILVLCTVLNNMLDVSVTLVFFDLLHVIGHGFFFIIDINEVQSKECAILTC